MGKRGDTIEDEAGLRNASVEILFFKNTRLHLLRLWLQLQLQTNLLKISGLRLFAFLKINDSDSGFSEFPGSQSDPPPNQVLTQTIADLKTNKN